MKNIFIILFIYISLNVYGQVGAPWVLGGNTPLSGTNTIGTNNNLDFRILTNGSEKAVVTTSGFVGIGNATSGTVPLVKLHIASGPSPADGTFRTWMETGTYYQDDSDHMYVGLDKNTGVSNRKNAMIGWGDRLI